MITHDVKQGTDAWKELRASHFTASEAPAMMGDSKYTSRQQLLQEKKTGKAAPVTPAQQAIFDKGHAAEDAARPIIEDMIGEELYPTTATSEAHPTLLASFDGITMLEDVVFEHKLYNQVLAENVRNGVLEMHYVWQLEQQLLVSGADRAIFVTSDGTAENMEHMWYESYPDRRESLIAGWEQFAQDLKDFEPQAKVEVVEAEEVVALPSVTFNVKGSKLVSNINDCLPLIKQRAELEMAKELETDLDFVNKESFNKAVKAARQKLKETVTNAKNEFSSFSDFEAAAVQIDGILQKLQSHGEKQVKTRKEQIKTKIVTDAASELNAHINELNKELVSACIPPIAVDFQAQLKGKRNLDSMREAVGEELARAKVEANKAAVGIRDNLAALENHAKGYDFLFSDLQKMITMEHTNFVNLVKVRVAEHMQAEEARKKQEEEDRQQREEQERQQREEQERQEQAAAQAQAIEEHAHQPEPVQTENAQPQELAPVVKHHVQPTGMSQVNDSTKQEARTLRQDLADWGQRHGVSAQARAELASILEFHQIHIAA
ncbi:hypothetical protein HBA55_29480 [Pseudomaricurvus alkylphenolicus]|uniref:lambda-exonuclease family protein n=1 Tax=Pseudomaricurvus alkylphenolicus TaxID=1306991 RepID=UPI00142294F8|nr:YqaJ viral recombinase family protein [Pseudomaricurvus alkylphenolicus]NIB43770.1 hypothetical protein [Pseudomaricurvus alkylphenolicus]